MLVVGPMGAGKSSYINSIKSIFNNKYIMSTHSSYSQNSATTKVEPIPITDFINLVDMPGFDVDCSDI